VSRRQGERSVLVVVEIVRLALVLDAGRAQAAGATLRMRISFGGPAAPGVSAGGLRNGERGFEAAPGVAEGGGREEILGPCDHHYYLASHWPLVNSIFPVGHTSTFRIMNNMRDICKFNSCFLHLISFMI
jgi:hypothetical protein